MPEQRWNKYFTPDDVGDSFIQWLRLRSPGSAVDICAGTGQLLKAVQRRWPSTTLTANDIASFETPAIGTWKRETQDGRLFAVDSFVSGGRYDLVIGNPPFGKARPLTLSLGDGLVPEDLGGLLKSSRMECAMTAASAMLVAPSGTLAMIVPETLVFGSTFRRLRTWLARSFVTFDIQEVPRGQFARKDLGLVFMAAYRKRRSKRAATLSRRNFINGSRMNYDAEEQVVIQRGQLVSSKTGNRGGALVVHCGGERAQSGYVLRRCLVQDARRQNQVWVEPGDIVVSRVGRREGCVAIYAGPSEAVLTDCMFKILCDSPTVKRKLVRIVDNGQLNTMTQQLVKGLGARFCKQSDLLMLVSALIDD